MNGMKSNSFATKISHFKKIALDTACFIYFFEDNKNYSKLCEIIFNLAKKGKLALLTSIICYTEIQSGAKKQKNIVQVRKYRNIFFRFPNLEVKDFSWDGAEIASLLRAKYNIRLPDAISISCGIMAEADVFITNDRNLKKIKEIPVILLKDFL